MLQAMLLVLPLLGAADRGELQLQVPQPFVNISGNNLQALALLSLAFNSISAFSPSVIRRCRPTASAAVGHGCSKALLSPRRSRSGGKHILLGNSMPAWKTILEEEHKVRSLDHRIFDRALRRLSDHRSRFEIEALLNKSAIVEARELITEVRHRVYQGKNELQQAQEICGECGTKFEPGATQCNDCHALRPGTLRQLEALRVKRKFFTRRTLARKKMYALREQRLIEVWEARERERMGLPMIIGGSSRSRSGGSWQDQADARFEELFDYDDSMTGNYDYNNTKTGNTKREGPYDYDFDMYGNTEAERREDEALWGVANQEDDGSWAEDIVWDPDAVIDRDRDRGFGKRSGGRWDRWRK